MPKSQPIYPEQAFRPDVIRFTDIPVCQYNKTLEEEKKNYTKDDFMRIYHDMRTIREFEHMLNEVKTKGAYGGIEYNYPGPAHLSIGQEASAVGQAFPLDINDLSFGSHRSHGEIIARGLVAIHKLPENELYDIMKNFLGGRILSIVEKHMPADNIKKLAQNFLLYGALAEVFARSTGFNLGLGGSMHCFFIPFGLMPNNAIVGGSAPIAVGAALYKRCNGKPGIVIANIGDGALGRGSVLEAMNFASMDQFTKLWGMDGKYSDKGLPILFNIFNNIYGMGGQTCGETMAFSEVARLGAGIAPNQMHAERIDGFNPLAVIDAYRRKRRIIENDEGPVLLDVLTYRFSGHSSSDAMAYRTKEEVEMWKEIDSIVVFRKQLLDAGVAT